VLLQLLQFGDRAFLPPPPEGGDGSKVAISGQPVSIQQTIQHREAEIIVA
jgi:hypothetical protein